MLFVSLMSISYMFTVLRRNALSSGFHGGRRENLDLGCYSTVAVVLVTGNVVAVLVV